VNQKYKFLLANGIGFFLLFGLCATAWILVSFNPNKNYLALLAAVWFVPALVIVASAFFYFKAEKCPRCGQRFSFEIESQEPHQVAGKNPGEYKKEVIVSKRCLSCAYLKEERRVL
jgi:hypothetical protein